MATISKGATAHLLDKFQDMSLRPFDVGRIAHDQEVLVVSFLIRNVDAHFVVRLNMLYLRA